MVIKNPLINDLRNRLMPQIDDPRKRFMQGLRSSLTGNLGQTTSTRSKSRKTKARNGVRRGRPVSASDG